MLLEIVAVYFEFPLLNQIIGIKELNVTPFTLFQAQVSCCCLSLVLLRKILEARVICDERVYDGFCVVS
jgi:hypothetical protein